MSKKWIREKCVSCSLCVALCPYEAFKQVVGKIEYDYTNCNGCEECLPSVGCPRRTIS